MEESETFFVENCRAEPVPSSYAIMKIVIAALTER